MIDKTLGCPNANVSFSCFQPASFVALREWCSDDETLTEVSLAPVSPSAPATVVTRQQEPASHKLPSPEQRVLALSLKYPPELVPIDVSGSSFKRLEKFRQSLIHVSRIPGLSCVRIHFLFLLFLSSFPLFFVLFASCLVAVISLPVGVKGLIHSLLFGHH